jgi:hypothetical protein
MRTSNNTNNTKTTIEVSPLLQPEKKKNNNKTILLPFILQPKDTNLNSVEGL